MYGRILTVSAGVIALLCTASPARAIAIAPSSPPIKYLSGTGSITFGTVNVVSATAAQSFASDAFTGKNDILTSVGSNGVANIFTVNSTSANSASVQGSLPQNGSMTATVSIPFFGTGSVQEAASGSTFSLSNSAGGQAHGTASFEVISTISNFVTTAAYNGTFGTFLALSGNLPNSGSAVVASQVTSVSDSNTSSPLHNLALTPEILGMSRVGSTFYADAAGGVSTIGLTSFTGFSGLSIDSTMVQLVANDHFTVYSTITVYADPASINSINPSSLLDPSQGLILPGFSPLNAVVPEPTSLGLSCAAGVSLLAFYARKRWNRMI